MAYEQKTQEIIRFTKMQIYDKKSFDFFIDNLGDLKAIMEGKNDPLFEAYDYAYWHIYDSFPEYHD